MVWRLKGSPCNDCNVGFLQQIICQILRVVDHAPLVVTAIIMADIRHDVKSSHRGAA